MTAHGRPPPLKGTRFLIKIKYALIALFVWAAPLLQTGTIIIVWKELSGIFAKRCRDQTRQKKW